ncbi:MAG: phosphate ABC transporter permease PtsA [Verrucomicrobia bacterium]|nr:MAG: phosphate ABC transporter permease PtsA [Verrucomicrobiota bacterium]
MNSPTLSGFFNSHEGSGRLKARSLFNRLLSILCVSLAFLTLLPLLSILYLVLKNGLPLLTPSVFTQLPPAAQMSGGGFGNAVVGTFIMVGIALLFAAPTGILSAIYINEYAHQSTLAHTVRFVSQLLTGIPSIISGVFAFAIVVVHTGFSAWAGGLALAILILPTILLTSEQALLSVSQSLREASTGLGATRLQTIWRIVLPEALPAMMTGLMLAIARAAGETAPVLFTALFSQYWPSSLNQPTASLAVLIYNFSTLPYDHQVKLAWTASLVLVAIVTVTNVAAQILFRKKHYQ